MWVFWTGLNELIDTDFQLYTVQTKAPFLWHAFE